MVLTVKREYDFKAGFQVRGVRHVPVDHPALKRARAAWGKRDSRAFNVMFLGDSLLEGFGPTTFERRPLQELRRILQQYDPVSRGVGYLPTRGGLSMDTKWTYVGTHDATEYGFGLGRRSTLLNSSDDRANLSFYGDRVWLFFTTGLGTFDAQITLDGVPVTINTQSSVSRGGWVWDSGLLLRGPHTLSVQTVSTGGNHAVILDGAMVFDGDGSAPPSVLVNMTTTSASTAVTSAAAFTAAMNGKKVFGLGIPAGTTFTYVNASSGTLSQAATASITGMRQLVGVNPPSGRGVRVWDAAHAGYQASAFGDTAASARYWADALTEVTPDIVFIDFMHNDKNQGITLAQYKTHLKGIIDNMDLVLTAAQRPSIVFVPPYVTSGNTEAGWAPWRLAMEQVAEDNGYAVLDLHSVLGDVHDATNDMIGVTSDNVHLSDAGSNIFAEMCAGLIMPGPAMVEKLQPQVPAFGERTVDFTFGLEDAGTIVKCNGTGIDATVPPNSTHPYPLGTQLGVYNANVSVVTFAQGAGVTIRGLGTVPQYGFGIVTKVGTDEWVQGGQTTPNTIAKVKSVDTLRTSTAVLADDPDLIAPIEANSKYHFRFRLAVNATSAADFKWALVAPGAADIDATVQEFSDTAELAAGVWDGTSSAEPTTFGKDINGVALTTQTKPFAILLIEGSIETDTAGNFALQWAQGASGSSNTILRERSSMLLVKAS